MSAAAYRSATRLYDERQGRFHNFSKKLGVIHSEILAPPGFEALSSDRGRLWNAVEARERRVDAAVAREVTFALPREFGRHEGVRLAQGFVAVEMVNLGMIADLNIHWDPTKGDRPQPHAHVLLTTRHLLKPTGRDQPELAFGLKQRGTEFYRQLLLRWRVRLAEHLNVRLAELGHDIQLDHRTFKAQGIGLEPQIKVGAAAARRRAQGQPADRLVQSEDIAARNGDRIIADPLLALNALTLQHATFTRQTLGDFLTRHSDDADQRKAAMKAVLQAPQIRALGRDRFGFERFTSLERLEVERRMERLAETLASRPLGSSSPFDAPFRSAPFSLLVSPSAAAKTAVLRDAGRVWAAQRLATRAVSPSEALAQRLTLQTGLAAISVNDLFRQDREIDGLGAAAVVLADEAGLMGAPQLTRIMIHAQALSARLVVIADERDFQAAEVGAACRALAERHGAFELRTGPNGIEVRAIPARAGPEAITLENGKVLWAGSSDYLSRFAERRAICGRSPPDLSHRRLRRGLAVDDHADDEHAGGARRAVWDERDVHRAIRRYAASAIAVVQAQRSGRLATDDQRRTLERASYRVASLWPGAKETLAAACATDSGLLESAAEGGTRTLLLAMEAGQTQRLETEIRKGWRHNAIRRPGLER